MLYKCSQCMRDFTKKSNLTRHQKVVHNIEVPRADIQPYDYKVYHYKCLDHCNVSFKYKRELRSHLKTEHDFPLEEQVLEFPNHDEFEIWLHKEEADNYVQYIHLTSSKKRGSTGVETWYYECNRTGKSSLLDESTRKRKARKRVSLKLDRGCTSQIIVNKKFNDNTYRVIYHKTHYGHDVGLNFVRLSKTDRGAIASKLLIGMSCSSVLNSISKARDGTLKRIDLLSRKDISNIKNSLKLAMPLSSKMHEMDTINIEHFVAECCQQEYNPILYNNVNANNGHSSCTCLMLMSKTQAEFLCVHEKNVLVVNSLTFSQCAFELVFLFLLDKELSRCIPIACMFTSTVDVHVAELFFEKILDRFNGEIGCDIFITNSGDLFHQAWTKVTGESPELLYNLQQITFNWKLNLNLISCAEMEVTTAKRKWVFDALNILQSLSDETQFMENLEETLKVLDSDQDFEKFLRYFLENFNYPRRWAAFHWATFELPSGPLENLNDLLRTWLRDNDDDNRFDKMFHNLIRYMRSESIHYLLSQNEERANFLTSENEKRHQLQITSKRGFQVSNLQKHCWNVTIDEKNVYVVKFFRATKCCKALCSICDICAHCLSCTCIDFFVNNVICEHIHYVYVTFLQSTMSVRTQDTQERPENEEEITIEIYDCVDSEPEDEAAKIALKIVEKCEEVAGNVVRVSDLDILSGTLQTLENLCKITNVKSALSALVHSHVNALQVVEKGEDALADHTDT